jgi:predicted metal-binding protein
MPCLFACGDFCTVHVRAPGKIGYVMGRFEPGEEAATAILDYTLLLSQSEHGQVPFRQWPKALKATSSPAPLQPDLSQHELLSHPRRLCPNARRPARPA